MTMTDQVPEETARRARAVLYLRVSTARQASKGGEAEGYSIPAQRKECTRRAKMLGAEVIEEFVDAGASARSADRPELQAMLARLKDGGIDFVIVHKIDRLARDRADDVAIGLAIHQAGATLVSASEAVDDSPSGTLLHGIMAAIAEFYSKNLSAEAKKGLHEKARRGGTPGYAPQGYRNIILRHEGIEERTVEIDEERAVHVRWAFESYATGEMSISEVTEELERRGMKSRPTAKFVGSPLTRSAVHRMLSNRYYVGRIVYGGVEYEGKHPALVDEETFWCVQAILSTRRIAGDRSWRHNQYLKGTVFCARCGERLCYGFGQGNGGEYAYFFCLGRKTKRTSCDLPYLPAEQVDDAVERLWRQVRFRTGLRDMVEAVMDEELRRQTLGNQKLVETQRKRIVSLDRQKQKILDAYLADAIEVTDLKQRQTGIQRELSDARRLLDGAESQDGGVRERLVLTLQLLERADQLYGICEEGKRATLNQVAFDLLYVDMDEHGVPIISEAVLNPEFAAVIELAKRTSDWRPGLAVVGSGSEGKSRRYNREAAGGTRCGRRQKADLGEEPEEATSDGGLDGWNLSYLAEREGFEPSDP